MVALYNSLLPSVLAQTDAEAQELPAGAPETAPRRVRTLPARGRRELQLVARSQVQLSEI